MKTPIPQLASVAMVMALAGAGCAATPGGGDQAFPIPLQIEAAETRAEHEALAKRYDDLAAAARRQGEAHRAMLRSYETTTFAHRYQKPGHIPVMERHCEALIRNADEAARIYADMAAQHREWAKDAP